ncbi:hypothetical protein B6K85_26195 [Vibrio sp. V1B]|uniref:hypothetical protein n=1 Tax=Vibrio sp. V1B TaxID=2047825 RepID=UPI000BAEA64D|nr:hypothetical protein [Vibrio sp. V1B]PAW07705.1 hypothetical protein B6K85_26195 [Vibrio sp. V1B]
MKKTILVSVFLLLAGCNKPSALIIDKDTFITHARTDATAFSRYVDIKIEDLPPLLAEAKLYSLVSSRYGNTCSRVISVYNGATNKGLTDVFNPLLNNYFMKSFEHRAIGRYDQLPIAQIEKVRISNYNTESRDYNEKISTVYEISTEIIDFVYFQNFTKQDCVKYRSSLVKWAQNINVKASKDQDPIIRKFFQSSLRMRDYYL